MTFIATVRPVDGERLAKEIDIVRIREARDATIPRKVENGIQEDPIPRNKFQID